MKIPIENIPIIILQNGVFMLSSTPVLKLPTIHEHKDDSARTARMEQAMQDEKWAVKKVGSKKYLTMRSKDYRIVTRAPFSAQERLVSVGGELNREVITLDPNSVYLGQLYAQLASRVRSQITNPGQPQNISAVLNLAMQFVRRHLDVRNGSNSKIALITNDSFHQIMRYKNQPVISINHFVSNRIGCCRHHALFLAYLLTCLINDGLLAPGNIFHNRSNLNAESAHTFVIYKPHHAAEIHLADSYWDSRSYNVRTSRNYLTRNDRYGAKTIRECEERYLDYKPFTHLTADQKQEFLVELLKKDACQRRVILNQQSAVGALNEIKTIFSSDSTPEQKALRKSNQFANSVSDISRIEKTDALHSNRYTELKVNEDKQQFIFGLLTSAQISVNALLETQRADDIAALETALTTDSKEQKQAFQHFIPYQNLLAAVRNRKQRLADEEKLRALRTTLTEFPSASAPLQASPARDEKKGSPQSDEKKSSSQNNIVRAQRTPVGTRAHPLNPLVTSSSLGKLPESGVSVITAPQRLFSFSGLSPRFTTTLSSPLSLKPGLRSAFS